MTTIKQFYRTNPVTMSLLSLMLITFLTMTLIYPFRATSNDAIFTFGGLLGLVMRLDPRQFWRLFTSNFIHIGLQHLLMNSFSLFIVGQIAEQLWSRQVYITLFFISGVFGGLLTIALKPEVLSAGASSAIFGLFAGVAVLGYFGHHPGLKQVGRSFQSLILINFMFNLFMPDVNLLGHLGGALGGALCAIGLPNRIDSSTFSNRQRWQAWLTLLGLGIGLLILFYWR